MVQTVNKNLICRHSLQLSGFQATDYKQAIQWTPANCYLRETTEHTTSLWTIKWL